MRLLHFDTKGELILTEDLIGNVPRYAILSHTWEADEVTLEDLQNGNYKRKAGYTKIDFCGQQARKDGLEYFWVDTCCIDKRNSSELAEAIVSMFNWYRDAARCYVFLSDVRARKRAREGSEALWKYSFRKSRWFTRGWTLQELLAPRLVQFFSNEGEYLGDKRTLGQMIYEITTIPRTALDGNPLINYKVSERLRWAEKRMTTRAEDRAYCLLGIFDVHMAPIYGEGDNAFNRLKDKIGRSFQRQLDGMEQPMRSPETRKHNTELVSTHAEKTSLHDHRRILLASLSFDQMDSRRSTIKTAHSTTCLWLLEHPAYLDWVDPKLIRQHHGFLWINGKPGAGKSTLVKFAHAQAAKQKPEHEIILSFFFNARGDELERSTVGLYRTLLYQLFNKTADLQTLLDEVHPVCEDQTELPIWTVELLCELFSTAVSRLGQRRLKCFIDALDECDEQQIQEMVYFFETLGQSAIETGMQLSICFASRHYPSIDIQNCRRLTLEDEKGHTEDLVKYVRNHLRAGKGPYIEEVRKQVQEKANGIFIWAVLVVDILNKEFLRGRIFAVKQKLQEIPTRLSDLFKDILRRDGTDMNDLLLCLQWILFAKRPLLREEFYFAMAAGLDPGCVDMTERDSEHVTDADIDRFVLNSSKGLAELTKSKAPTVQFIHESVRDFLLKDNGLTELWPELRDDVYSPSHDQLKRCCQNYLKINTLGHVLPDILPESFSNFMKDLRATATIKFPFLKYAHGYILHHANEAAVKIPQNEFLKDWPKATWLIIGNLFAQGNIRRHTPNASLLYLLAEHGFARLIRTLHHKGPVIGTRGERYQYPLFAALANGHRDAARTLLTKHGDVLSGDVDRQLEFGKAFSARKDQSPLLWALENEHEALAKVLATSADLDPDFKNKQGRNALSIAAGKGAKTVVHLLVETHRVDINNFNNVDQSLPLLVAARCGQTKVVRQLLPMGSIIEATDCLCRTALHWAALSGHETTVRLLLERGANIEATDKQGWTALRCAALSGHETTVRLLLERGANIEAVDKQGKSALHWAALIGYETTVRLLLERGANIEAVTLNNETALHWAARYGHEITVSLLLERGANIEARDKYGKTPILWAADKCHVNVIRLLIAQNAIVNTEDIDGRTPLHWAVGSRSYHLLNGTKFSQLSAHDQTILLERHHNARSMRQPQHIVNSSEVETVTLLLDHGANIHATDKWGKTALDRATEVGMTDVVQFLESRLANVNAIPGQDSDAILSSSQTEEKES